MSQKKVYRYKKKRKISALDIYVVFSICTLLIYTIVERRLQVITGMSADTLTTCVFATFGGEILSCALIKIFKLKEGEKNGTLPLM